MTNKYQALMIILKERKNTYHNSYGETLKHGFSLLITNEDTILEALEIASKSLEKQNKM